MALIHNKLARFYTSFLFCSIALFTQYSTTIYGVHNNAKKLGNTTLQQPLDIADPYQLKEMTPTIRNIIIHGNNLAPEAAILYKLPFKSGQKFSYIQTSEAIKKIYSLGFFKQIQLALDEIDEDNADLHVIVTEKPKLTDVTISGNKHLKDKDIHKAIDLDNLITLSEAEVSNIIQKVKKAYIKKSYHNAEISTSYKENHDDQTCTLHITIKEGKPSHIAKITFTGNKRITSKQLKKVLISREDWILSPLDRSGTYQEEMIQADKAILEHTYKNHGFMHAKVKDIHVYHNPTTNNYELTYDIHEGDRFYIKEISAPGNDQLSEHDILQRLPLRVHMPYSEEGIHKSIEAIRMLWGEFGYIFADIEPSIDVDEKQKTVNLAFYSDLKEKINLHRINIKGNKKTRDYVIRRNLNLKEGKLITNRKMENSKAAVQRLGFFDERTGVNWKINRIDDSTADLDLLLQEKKTGRFEYSMNYGGNPKNMGAPQTGLTGKLLWGDRNFRGTGMAIKGEGEFGKSYKNAGFNLVQPWLFHKPIRSDFAAYLRRSEYEEGIHAADKAPQEKVFGGTFGLGYVTSWLDGIMLSGHLGFEEIEFVNNSSNKNNTNVIEASSRYGTAAQQEFQAILNESFKNGSQYWLEWNVGQDQRNGIAFPTTGHKVTWNSRLALPVSSSPFSYFKTLIDASWYTPLIGMDDLVLCVHGQAGWVKYINEKENKSAPWKELFHVGGPATVRGYTYGQIGPTWKEKNSLGARKMLTCNIELIAPLTPDRGTRAVIFYDGGAGWDTPTAPLIKSDNLRNNEFFYRHTFGFGIRLTSPTPVQVDWGVKLNPSKNFKNNLTEMHLNMIHEF